MTTEPEPEGIRVVGLDLSLSATGIATAAGPSVFSPHTTKPLDRLFDFDVWITDILDREKPQLVVIENYAFGAKFSREALAELHGIIKLALFVDDVPIALVAPTQLKKYATGAGNANKDEMIGEAVRYGCPVNNNNAVDAWWLRNMALTFYYAPGAPELPKAQRDVVNKITWPMELPE